MIRKKFLIVFFLALCIHLAEGFQGIEEKPSTSRLPDIFSAAKFRNPDYLFDIVSGIHYPLFYQDPVVSFYSGVYNTPFGKGNLTAYTNSYFNTEDSSLTLKPVRLSYNRNIKEHSFGFGIGYDLDKDNIFNTGKKVYENIINNTVNIKATTENSFYTNLNTSVNINKNRDLLIGADIRYSSKRGFYFC